LVYLLPSNLANKVIMTWLTARSDRDRDARQGRR